MKKLLLFIIVLSSFFTLNSFAQTYGWYVISPQSIPGTPNFSDVYFVNDNEGWITSNYPSPMIFHTTDGGETFEIQSTEYGCNAIHMLSENEGYAGGASGFVYRTTDGGENWNFHGTTVSNIADISFPPSGDTGYACGINGNIHAISSSGVTKMTSGVPDTQTGISFPVNSSEGWVCGGSIIRHFINGEWTGDQDYPSGGYYAIHFLDNNNGWAVGDKIIHTTDGKNWIAQTNPSTKTLYDVFFLNAQEGWAVGSGGTIIQTTNGGTTWTVVGSSLTTNSLTGVHFVSTITGNVGYVVGNGKTLLKYGTLTSVENEEELPTEFSLSQNYPNPFNPSTKISWQSPVGSWQTLKVYDVLGNEVATLVDEYKPAGTYEVEFNPESSIKYPASGIYFYQLKAGNFIQTKKMAIIK